jgi:UrcA family protein
MRVFPHGLLIGTAIGLLLIASSAGAQDYPPPPDAPYYGTPNEEVIVRAPPYVQHRSAIGAPIEDVAVSREVVIGDLDLRTGWGVHELRSRISFTATTLCNRLNAMYPVSADNSSDRDCYRNAMRDAMAQAHDAIRAARGYGGY